jgi:hypothetical protein
MKKTVFRYFFNAIEGQEKWLNKMAAQGFRLVKTTNLTYTFEICKPSQYEYKIEFAANKSYRELLDYQEFLRQMGYKVLTKNMNINLSYGKVKWRPWAAPASSVTASPGSFNRELLIVEKVKNDEPFELHTSLEDIIAYYRTMRNAYGFVGIMLILLTAFGISSGVSVAFSNIIKFITAAISVLSFFIAAKYTLYIRRYKEEGRISE